jgi:predicted nuclease of predicted toxin-antitoxin system
MLKLLLDEQISPDVAVGLRRKCKNLTVCSLADWEDGRFLGMADEAILEEARAQNLILVTYDLKTIPPVLKTWMEAGRDHCGVIFVDNKTIPSSDVGGLIRALHKLSQDTAESDWASQIWFLRRRT